MNFCCTLDAMSALPLTGKFVKLLLVCYYLRTTTTERFLGCHCSMCTVVWSLLLPII